MIELLSRALMDAPGARRFGFRALMGAPAYSPNLARVSSNHA
jgi:hypothetical protein